MKKHDISVHHLLVSAVAEESFAKRRTVLCCTIETIRDHNDALHSNSCIKET